MYPLLTANPTIGEIELTVRPGATILRAVETSIHAITTYQPKLIIVTAGICNITKKDHTTKVITLRNTIAEIIIASVMDDIEKAHLRIRRITKAPISFATITGADLADINHKQRRHMSAKEYRQYVNCHKIIHPDQETLNNVIYAINRRITAFNYVNHTPTTWMAEVVHPYIRGKHKSYYTRLADGCHPTPNTRRRWAHQIARTIKRASTPTEAK